MKSIRLLPVVILAITALLVLKTMGLAITGSYVLGGVTTAQAAEHSTPPKAGEGEGQADGITMPSEPTMADSSPTLADHAPTIGEPEGGHKPVQPETELAKGVPPAAEGGHGGAASEGALPEGLELACAPTDTAAVVPAEAGAEHEDQQADSVAEEEPHGAGFAANLTSTDCVPLVDAVPHHVGANGQPVPLTGTDGQSLSEKALLSSLGQRRTELETYERELTLRASLVDAAEKKVQERQTTLQSLEDQISALVDQRTAMENGQFAGIVTLYENMKPKDAANIFNSLDMEVLLRVAKTMNPRKMSPILAAMDAPRAQELTVRMAGLADQPSDQMTPDDLAALPQIVGQNSSP